MLGDYYLFPHMAWEELQAEQPEEVCVCMCVWRQRTSPNAYRWRLLQGEHTPLWLLFVWPLACSTEYLQDQIGSQAQRRSSCDASLSSALLSGLWFPGNGFFLTFWNYLCALFLITQIWGLGDFWVSFLCKNGSFWSSYILAQLGPPACGLRDSCVTTSWHDAITNWLSGERFADTTVCIA